MGAAAQQMSDDGWAPWQGALSDPNQGGDVSWRQDPGRMLGRGGGGEPMGSVILGHAELEEQEEEEADA